MTTHQLKGENQITVFDIRWRFMMKKKQILSGVGCLVLAAVLVLLDLTFLKTSFSGAVQTNVQLYPAVFFGLLGLVLVVRGTIPLRSKK